MSPNHSLYPEIRPEVQNTDLHDKFLYFFVLCTVSAIFRRKIAKIPEKWTKWAEKRKYQKYVNIIFRNHYFAPLVQFLDHKNDFNDFSQVNFEIWLNYRKRPFSRRSTRNISTTERAFQIP